MNAPKPSRTLGLLPGFLGLLFTIPLLVGGCLYDPDDRCGKDQTLVDGLCVCNEGLTLVDRRCVETLVFEGLLDECDLDTDCPASGASTCVDDEGERYCSIGTCESSVECPENFACDVEAESPACLLGPSGFGEPCEDEADCEGFEASYCEVALEKICMQECGSDPGVCAGDWACCDFSDLIGAALCVSPADFDDGNCPFGVRPLEAN